MCTLVCLGVVTLEQCLLAAAPALSKGIFAKMGDMNASGIKHAILAALREWLYARAVGLDAPLLGSCPALRAEACFDAGCPLAASVGLKTVSMFPNTYAGWHLLISMMEAQYVACDMQASSALAVVSAIVSLDKLTASSMLS